MTAIKISVIIPVYNGASYLARTIESVLLQAYPVHEIIVVDDGSMDDSPRILKSFKDRIVVKTTRNSGVASAMNQGIGLATGDWAAFLDQDDLWFKNKLKKQVETLAECPRAGFSVCNYTERRQGASGRLNRHFSKLRSPEIMKMKTPFLENPIKILIQENFIGTSSAVMIRRDVMEMAGLFDVKYKICTDYDYWLRCGLITGFAVSPEVLFYKRVHVANASKSSVKTFTESLTVLGNFLQQQDNFISKTGLKGRYKLSMSKSMYDLGNAFFDSGNRKKAFGHYVKALRNSAAPSNLALFFWVVFKKSVRWIMPGMFRQDKFEGLS